MKEEMLYPSVQQTPGGREEGGEAGTLASPPLHGGVQAGVTGGPRHSRLLSPGLFPARGGGWLGEETGHALVWGS